MQPILRKPNVGAGSPKFVQAQDLARTALNSASARARHKHVRTLPCDARFKASPVAIASLGAVRMAIPSYSPSSQYWASTVAPAFVAVALNAAARAGDYLAWASPFSVNLINIA